MQEDEESSKLDHYMTKSIVWSSLVTGDRNSRLIPVAKWLASVSCFAEKWLSHSISYTILNTLIPTKCRKLPERNPKEKQDRFIHNLIHLILQIALLSPFLLSYLTKFRVVRWFLVFGKQFRREPIHIGLYNGLIMGSGKLEKTRFDVTLLDQEAWRAYVHWVD